jgi:hypothetical protein
MAPTPLADVPDNSKQQNVKAQQRALLEQQQVLLQQPQALPTAFAADEQLGALRTALDERDARISTLQLQLDHFRGWLAGLHAQASAQQPHVLKNARRLYVGGIPASTCEVCWVHLMLMHGCVSIVAAIQLLR